MTTQNIINVSKPLDENGHLKDYTEWDLEFAHQIAAVEKIKLTKEHLEIITSLRNLYHQYAHIPPKRIIAKFLSQELGCEKSSTLYLTELFGENPLKKMSRISGLPKPRHCL